ncbi:aspartate carbamoyltransferase catalytic subunit [Ornithinibacillus bavariensis]|uniref:Aspartate carbamoyltransferase n=1 Tax=Ornithinibacillus bavariensis TaxID=545502 RepID=A0A919X6S1_9BACI|nr:aspartate carbamoyltransferase catalytic subunit [Ornithinibacillus bavariensis]GIO26084.1 aspartate carbamoyltransferase [Ornithinibacillus bavariensis]HAM82177.1 aspartate carbamoyltransferase [Ornithinibacillus sp.]
MKHFISMKQLTNDTIFHLIETAELCKSLDVKIPNQLFSANLFFEPSTRTKMSFTVAERRLGLEMLDFHTETSSLKKGESLYDTVKTLESIGANIAIIRHESDDWMTELDTGINIPIINAGAGKAEHPTQCMLDLMTIYQEFGRFIGLNIGIVGDIKHSRVAKSNAYALHNLGANVFLCSPPGYEDHTLGFPCITIDEAVENLDVLMLLRIQHERHQRELKTEGYLEYFGLTKEREGRMKEQAIILHPAPINRGIEIDSDLVECGRSRIFKQMSNGVYMRMAIIVHMLTEWGIINGNFIKKCETISG